MQPSQQNRGGKCGAHLTSGLSVALPSHWEGPGESGKDKRLAFLTAGTDQPPPVSEPQPLLSGQVPAHLRQGIAEFVLTDAPACWLGPR